MTITVTPVPMLSDNYSWLLQDDATGQLAIVDPAAAEPAISATEAAGGKLELILLTHHHDDHIGGVPGLVARYGAKVAGNAADAPRLPKLDFPLREGDAVDFAGNQGQVLDTPGHTIGHIAYYFGAEGLLFCGDTLFSLGCGRLFEGTPADMFGAMGKFLALPDGTRIFAGHEYTASNLKFALHVDPDNAALLARAAEIQALRAAGKPTLPVTLGAERATNPFLRAGSAAELGALRAAKDRF